MRFSSSSTGAWSPKSLTDAGSIKLSPRKPWALYSVADERCFKGGAVGAERQRARGFKVPELRVSFLKYAEWDHAARREGWDCQKESYSSRDELKDDRCVKQLDDWLGLTSGLSSLLLTLPWSCICAALDCLHRRLIIPLPSIFFGDMLWNQFCGQRRWCTTGISCENQQRSPRVSCSQFSPSTIGCQSPDIYCLNVSRPHVATMQQILQLDSCVAVSADALSPLNDSIGRQGAQQQGIKNKESDSQVESIICITANSV